MVTNNIDIDVKLKCIEKKMSQVEIAEHIGTSGQYINRVINKKDGHVNKTLVKIMETLGYDIELRYIPREEE